MMACIPFPSVSTEGFTFPSSRRFAFSFTTFHRCKLRNALFIQNKCWHCTFQQTTDMLKFYMAYIKAQKPQNARFCCHKDGWKTSPQSLKSSWFCQFKSCQPLYMYSECNMTQSVQMWTWCVWNVCKTYPCFAETYNANIWFRQLGCLYTIPVNG